MFKTTVHPVVEHPVLSRVLGFVKTTLTGGLIFLAPIVVLIVLLAKAAHLLRRFTRPLASRLSVDSVFGFFMADLVAIVLVVVACFVAGLIARVSLAERFVKKAEAGVLWRIPGYGFVKGLTDSLDKSASAHTMIPVLVHFDDYSQLAFEVDRAADGRRVIYVPSSPDPRAGSVVVMDAERVEPVSLTFVKLIASLRGLGRGIGPSLSPPS